MGRIYKRGDTYYADFVDRHHRRVQQSLRTTDRAVAKARLRDLELSTTDSGLSETTFVETRIPQISAREARRPWPQKRW